MKLRTRLLLVALLPVVLLAALLTTAFVIRLNSDLEQALATRGQALARQLAATAEFGVLAGQREQLAMMAEGALRADPDARGVAVIDAASRQMAASGTLHAANWPRMGRIEPWPLTDNLILFVEPVRQSVTPVDDIYSGAEPKVGAGDTAAPRVVGYAVIEMSTQVIRARRDRLIVAGALLALLSAVLASVLARRIARSVTQPLLSATDVVRRIGEGEVTARMDPAVAGALRNLAAGINAMAGRIGMTHEELQQRVTEATMQLREEKEIALRATIAKSYFLAAAAHDLRQPLHALELFVAALARSPAAADEPRLIESTQTSVATLREMFDAILDLSGLDEGMRAACIEGFPMDQLLTDLLHNFAPLAEQKGLRLKVRGCCAHVASDRHFVERILFNFISNALRYTPRGGVLIGCRRRGDAMRVEVWDSGEGIPQAAWEYIFDEYVQLNNPERNREKGLGLGLAICRRLAALLGTPIGVRSRPGRGSVFWIELPLVFPAETDGSS